MITYFVEESDVVYPDKWNRLEKWPFSSAEIANKFIDCLIDKSISDKYSKRESFRIVKVSEDILCLNIS